ncbi:transcription initiation at TATA-containing promoter protein [Microsporum ferrugineum]
MTTPPNEGAAVVPGPVQPAPENQPGVQTDVHSNESSSKTLPKTESPAEQAEAPSANGNSQPQLNGHSSISNGVEPKPEPSGQQEPPPTDLLSPVGQPENHKTAGVESETAALHLGSSTGTEDVKRKSGSYAPVKASAEATEVDSKMEMGEDSANKGDTSNVDTNMGQDHAHDSLFSSAPAPAPSEGQSVDHDMGITPAPVVSHVTPSQQEEKPESMTTEVDGKGKEDYVMKDVPEASPSAGEPTTSKVSREREDDEEERAAKRKKTEDLGPDQPALEGPALPPSSSAEPAAPATPAPETSNGLPDVLRDMTKAQTKFFTRTFQNLKRLTDAQMFKFPVDPIKLNIPTYYDFVKHPMDLQTMEGKLKSESYRTPQEVVDDFKLMVNNSKTFNGPGHVVSQAGDRLYENFEKQLKKLPGHDEPDVTPAEKKTKKAATLPTKTQPSRRETRPAAPPPPPPVAAPAPRASTAGSPTFALGPEGLPLIRRDSTTVDGRPKRSIHPPKNRDLPFSMRPKKKKFQLELKFCQEVLDELHKQKHYPIASFFYVPVDPVALNIPTYHNVIKKPMDLQTMQTKLSTGQYENAKEFETDMRQIFKNCYKFNIVGDPVYSAGKATEDLFDRKWSQKARWLEAHEPASGHQSAGSSDESDEHEEEDSDDDQEKLTMLQKQIAEMSKQVEAITKKKKTPPASKKLTKSKGKKDGKKGAAGTVSKKDKKGGGSKAKSEKNRYITYQEKTMISNGISSLPEHKVSEALAIIQKDVPSLRGLNESEIELDIDELPNNVLLTLLKFVKQNAPASVLDGLDEPSDAEPLPSLPQPKPKKSKPMNKTEQEKQIRSLQSNLSKFKGGAGSGSAAGGHSYEQAHMSESSGDDEDSEESEEE